MAQVFWQNAAGWAAMPLLETCYRVLVEGAAAAVEVSPATATSLPWPALVHRPTATGKGQWLCVASPEGNVPRVNGDPVVGFRILAHRDVLEVAGGRFFFSAEAAARVEIYQGPPGKRCPRCRLDLNAGDAVVRCPGCGTVHHLLPDRNCWTYGPRCAVCAQPTAMDGGTAWTPEGL